MARPTGVLPLIGGLLLLVSGTPLGAQSLSGGVDVGLANDYVWRGLTLSNRPTVHPAVWAALHTGSHTTTAGVWSWIEPRTADPGQLTGAGRQAGRLAEIDLWTQHSWKRLTGGIIHYLRTGDPETGGLDDGASFTEAYLSLWPAAGSLPLDPRLTAYLDVEGDRGAFLELSLSRSVPILPMWPNLAPLGDLLLQATSGAYLGNEAARPGERVRAYAASSGVSHLDLAAIATLQLPASTYGHLIVHHQWSFDDATRLTSLAERQGTRWWFEGGISVLFGDPEP